eukprot:gene14774-biopygen4485
MYSGDEQQSEPNEDESLQRLKKIRGGNRAKTTKLINEAEEIIQRYPRTEEIDPEIRNKLEIKVQSIKEKRDYLTQLDNEIIQKCSLDEIDREVDQSTDICTRIDESIAKVRNYLNTHGNSVERRTTSQSPDIAVRPPPTISTPPRQPTQQVSESPVSQRSTSNGRSQGVRLPKITLPRFNGDITKFQQFWQSFCCAVDESEELSEVHKLNYLVNSLEGQAYKALEGLQICEENYEKAKVLLKERFGKKQGIISAHMQALLKLQSCENEKITDLRVIYDTIMVHIRGLESLGMSSDKYGSLLIPVIISRMPEDIALQVTRQTSKDVWSVDEIMTTIQQEIEARECKEVTDLRQRKAILQAAKRCFKCLRVGHVSKDCSFNRKCFNCNGNHNSALCNKDEQELRQESSVAMSNVKEKTNVMLQTATAIAYGEDRSKKVTVSILFDNGSQKSFISEELKPLADSVDVSNKRIDILIGADHYYDIVIGEVIKDVIPSREEIVDESREIVESLDRFWKHESMGIANDEQPGKCAPTEIMFKENQRYEVGLPWKDNIDNELETNYDLSKRRLLSLYNKLKADPKLLKQYNEFYGGSIDDIQTS